MTTANSEFARYRFRLPHTANGNQNIHLTYRDTVRTQRVVIKPGYGTSQQAKPDRNTFLRNKFRRRNSLPSFPAHFSFLPKIIGYTTSQRFGHLLLVPSLYYLLQMNLFPS
jgi:hypothetical protein